MQNLGMILRLMKRIAPGLDVKATAEEIRSRIGDELDYELEAQNQRSLSRIFRGHPFIVVPDVVTTSRARRCSSASSSTAPASTPSRRPTRPRATASAEIVFRFYFGCMYRHRQFSGDPHPGNFLLLGDGRVAFLDFGLFKVMPRNLIELELETQRAGHEGDAQRLWEIWAEGGLLQQPDRFRPDKLLSQFLDATWWYLTDEEIELGPEIATQVMIDMSDPRSEHFGQMRHETLPADHIFGRRVEMLTLAVLGQLRATRQLAPDRARVDLRRRAGHGARPRRGAVLQEALVETRVSAARTSRVETASTTSSTSSSSCLSSLGSASHVTCIRPVWTVSSPTTTRPQMTSPSSQPMRSRSNHDRWTWLALPPHGHVLSWCSLASQTARMFLPEASTLTPKRLPSDVS